MKDFEMPEENGKYCLLLDLLKNRKGYFRGRITDIPDPHDYQLAAGPEEVKSYLSAIFGDVGDTHEFIENIDESGIRKIISKYNFNGDLVEAGLCLCDTGEGGGAGKVYSQSKRFRLSK